MEKFQTHIGPKTVDEIIADVTKKPGPELFKAELAPTKLLEDETVRVGISDFVASDASRGTYLNPEATGPVGPTHYPAGPLGANGPAGPVAATGPTGWSFSAADGVAMVRERAEVDLRQGIRRCLKEGVPMDRIVEIFRLELIDLVHDD